MHVWRWRVKHTDNVTIQIKKKALHKIGDNSKSMAYLHRYQIHAERGIMWLEPRFNPNVGKGGYLGTPECFPPFSHFKLSLIYTPA